MTNRIIKNKYILYLLTFFVLFILTLSCFSYSSFAEGTTGNLGGTFSIQAKKGTTLVGYENEGIYSNGTIYTYKWKNIDKLVISFKHDNSNPPPNNEQNQQVYSLSVSLEYLQGYTDSVFNPTTIENAFGPYNNLTLSQLDKNIEFDVNIGITNIPSGSTTPVTISGWGIYRFKININGAEKYSDYYFIEPDYEIANKPIIDKTVINSDNSLHDSFNFYITNSEDYKYIDTSTITWYVKGESDDGVLYALTKEDLENPNFINCTKSIYKNITRTGASFLFNDNEIAGEWEVWCEYRYHDSDTIVKSESIKVKTGNDSDASYVIWIVIALSVVSIIVVIVVGIVRSKKEKVW